MNELIEFIEKKIDHKLKVIVDPNLCRSTDEKIIVGDIEKLKRDTGWKQEITMEQTIADMLDYWRNKKF